MSNVVHRARLAGALSIMSILAAAGTTLAQSAKVEGSLDQPMKAKASGGGQGNSSMMMKSVEGDDTYEVSIVNGETTAKINGKKLPEDRIRRSGGTIELLDREHNVVHTFHVGTAGGGRVFSFGGQGGAHGGESGQPFSIQVAPEGQTGQWRMFTPGQGAQGLEGFQAVQAEPPPVMLGVTMSDPSDEEREQYDLGDDKGIRIDRVIEGLPADEAGVEAGDIVLSVNGKPASADDLRAVLKEKKAGDTITLRVARGDDKKSIKVELAKYDAEKLGNTVMAAPAFGQGGQFDAEAWEKMNEEMQKMFGQGGAAAGGHGGEFHGRVLGVRPGQPGEPGQQMQWYTIPGDQGKRLEELSERLEKLDARLDELNRKLEKLAASLDKK